MSIQAIPHEQIKKVAHIVEEINALTPSKRVRAYEGSQFMAKVHYDDNSISAIEDEITKWQYATKAALTATYGANNDHVSTFERTFVDVRLYMDAKRELLKEINAGRTVIESILDAESIKDDLNDETELEFLDENSKSPKIFISHNQQDKSYSDALVDLLLKLGIKQKAIFCSSYPGFGVPMGEDFIHIIRNQFEQYKLIVIFVHSPRFYTSHISLCEMGAAWIQGCKVFSFLTKDCVFSELTGVIRSSELAFRAGQADTYNLLSDFYDYLRQEFSLEQIATSTWEKFKAGFVESVERINYDPIPQSEGGNNGEISSQGNNTRDRIIEYVNKTNSVSKSQIANNLGLSVKTMDKILRSLCEEGVLKTTGKKQHTEYSLVNCNK